MNAEWVLLAAARPGVSSRARVDGLLDVGVQFLPTLSTWLLFQGFWYTQRHSASVESAVATAFWQATDSMALRGGGLSVG